MVDKKINFTLFILVVNQIHNLHKQLKMYIFFVQTILRKYLKQKPLSNIKLLNTVLLLEIFIEYHSNDVPEKILKVQ